MYKTIVVTVILGAIGYLLYMYAWPQRVRSGPVMKFDGTGYTSFGAGSEYDVKKTHFSLDVKTTSSSGILVYARAEDDDYFSASLAGGKVLVQVDMGSGPFPIQSNVQIDDGKWHSVSFKRHKKDVILVVDDELLSATSPTANSSISRPSVVYVGGNNVAESTRFVGCIRNLNFNDRFDIQYDYTPGGVTLGCPGQ